MIRNASFHSATPPERTGMDAEPLLSNRNDEPASQGEDRFSLRNLASSLLETVTTLCQSKKAQENDAIEPKLQTLAEKFQCRHTHPFNQSEFKASVPEVVAALPKGERDQGWCFGLSLSWCQQRLSGKADEEIFTNLANWQGDSLLLRTVALQTVEQDRHLGQHDKQFEHLAALAGMECIAANSKQVAHRIPTLSIERFADRLERLLDSTREQQALICDTTKHVIALHRDKNDHLHLFDPNYGVVSCPLEHKRNLCAFLFVQLNIDDDLFWKNAGQNPGRFLLTAELQPSARLREQALRVPTPLPALSLMAAQDMPGPSGTKS